MNITPVEVKTSRFTLDVSPEELFVILVSLREAGNGSDSYLLPYVKAMAKTLWNNWGERMFKHEGMAHTKASQ